MAKIDQDIMMRLYELAVEDERFENRCHHDRLNFYCGLLTAVLSGTLVGLFVANDPHERYVLLLGPVALFLLALVGDANTRNCYVAWLRKLTVRAKLEQCLGLTERLEALSPSPGSYWPKEPVVPPEYMQSRSRFASSEEFVADRLSHGYGGLVRHIFAATKILSGVLFLFLLTVCVGWWQASGSS